MFTDWELRNALHVHSSAAAAARWITGSPGTHSRVPALFFGLRARTADRRRLFRRRDDLRRWRGASSSEDSAAAGCGLLSLALRFGLEPRLGLRRGLLLEGVGLLSGGEGVRLDGVCTRCGVSGTCAGCSDSETLALPLPLLLDSASRRPGRLSLRSTLRLLRRLDGARWAETSRGAGASAGRGGCSWMSRPMSDQRVDAWTGSSCELLRARVIISACEDVRARPRLEFLRPRANT